MFAVETQERGKPGGKVSLKPALRGSSIKGNLPEKSIPKEPRKGGGGGVVEKGITKVGKSLNRKGGGKGREGGEDPSKRVPTFRGGKSVRL